MIRTDYDDRVEFVDYSLRLVVPKTLSFAQNIVVYVDGLYGDRRLAPIASTWEYQDMGLQQQGSLFQGQAPFNDVFVRNETETHLEFIDGAVRLVFPKTEDFAAHMVTYLDLTLGDPRLPLLDVSTWSAFCDAVESGGSLMGVMPAEGTT